MERKDIIILVISLLLFLALLSSAGLFLRNRKQAPQPEPQEQITVVEGTLARDATPTGGNKQEQGVAVGSSSYFVTPSPDEILTALRAADGLDLRPRDEAAPPMKVMWPGYFFSRKTDASGKDVVQLDVDENGFGVVLLCTVDLTAYPEVAALEKGQKIWVAGEVTAIDPSGTGTVSIDAEYLRFDEGPSTAQNPARGKNETSTPE